MDRIVDSLSLFQMLTIYYERKFKVHAKKTDLVLDIGSGNLPHPWAKVLCDKSLYDDRERTGSIVRDHRPLVAGDAESLTFVNKAFDYVIASQLLEHLEDPERFFSELTRIAKAGYTETPTEFLEKVAGVPQHKLFVRLEGDCLVITRKKEQSLIYS